MLPHLLLVVVNLSLFHSVSLACLPPLTPTTRVDELHFAGGFFLFKGGVSFPLSPKVLLKGGFVFFIMVGSLSYNMKRLEATVVLIWH